jgi:hypothetical protein
MALPARRLLLILCAGKGEGRLVIEAPDNTHVRGTSSR